MYRAIAELQATAQFHAGCGLDLAAAREAHAAEAAGLRAEAADMKRLLAEACEYIFEAVAEGVVDRDNAVEWMQEFCDTLTPIPHPPHDQRRI